MLLSLLFRRSLTGAWIETTSVYLSLGANARRSLTGAWIETTELQGPLGGDAVAPLRGRGLKRSMRRAMTLRRPSLPYGGVD